MAEFETYVKYGIAAALHPKDILSDGAFNEVNTSGIEAVIPFDKFTSDYELLLGSYLGFFASATVRFFCETREHPDDIVRMLSTVQATDNIIYKLSGQQVFLNWQDIEKYVNTLLDTLVPDKRLLSPDIPSDVNDASFIDYVLTSVKDAISENTCSIENKYGVVFEDKLSDDVQSISLPFFIRPCETRAATDMPVVKDPLTGSKKRQRTLNPVEIVHRLISDFGLATVGPTDMVVIYNRKTGHYEAGLDEVIKSAVNNVFLHINTNMEREIRNFIKTYSGIPHYDLLPDKYIVMNNCIIDVTRKHSDGTFYAYELSPSWVTPHYYSVDYNPAANTSFVYEVLHDGIAVERDDIYQNLLEISAFIFYQKASGYVFMLHNEDARGDASNGKSTYLSLCTAICENHYTTLDIQELAGEHGKFNTVDLEHSLCNIGEDLPNVIAKSGSISALKSLSTGNRVSVQQKFVQGTRTISSIAQHVYACNIMPRFQIDNGFLRRFHLIPMNAHFAPGKPGFKQNISSELRKDENIQGFALLALNVLHNMYETNDFTPTSTPESRALVSEFKLDNSTVMQWMADRDLTPAAMCYRGYQHFVTSSSNVSADELYKIGTQILHISPAAYSEQKVYDSTGVFAAKDYFTDYKNWCDENKYLSKSSGEFLKEIVSHIGLKKQKTTTDGKREHSASGFLGKKQNSTDRKNRQFYRFPDPVSGELRFTAEIDDEQTVTEELSVIAHRLPKSELDIHKKRYEENGWSLPDFLK